MSSLVLCYAEADRGSAAALAQFLEANLPVDVSLEEGIVKSGFDLIDAAERALSAEFALILLSPDSVPKPWSRERWEPVLFEQKAEFGTRLGFVLLRECRFPELFRRGSFFDLSRDFAAGLRQIKRWLLRPDFRPESEPKVSSVIAELRTGIADRPGVASLPDADLAKEFIRLFSEDFEAVHQIDCRGRTRAGIVGTLGTAAGIRLPNAVDENRLALERHCQTHRYLFVFENLAERDRDLAEALGRCSAILTDTAHVPASRDELAAAFFVSPRDESRCAALLGHAWEALQLLLESDFENALRLGWAMVSVLKSFERFAETVETLDAMAEAARERDDKLALFRIDWERLWFGDSAAPALNPPLENTQLELFAAA